MNTATRDMIAVGPISIRFRIESADSNGSVTVFECTVPPQVPVPAAHSHDAFEETIYGLAGVLTWTIDGHDVPIGPGMPCAFPAAPCTDSSTTAMSTRPSCASRPPACSDPPTSKKSLPY